MPLHIDRVHTELEIMPQTNTTPGTVHPSTHSATESDGRSLARDAGLKERLRPIVMEIVQEELDKVRRQQGRA